MIFLLEKLEDRFNELEVATNKYATSKMIKYIPFSYTFDMVLEKPYDKYFPIGSVNTMLLTKDLGAKVFFTNDNYDYIRFAKEYGDDFINSDLKQIKFKDLMDLNLPYFIRDAFGDNIIKGKVKKTNEEFLKLYAGNYGRSLGKKKIDDDYPIIVARPKMIESEYRFFVIKNKIITGSMYNFNGEFWIKNIDNIDDPLNNKLWKYAEDMIQKYSPDESFVIDIAILESGNMKVLECNCINCSGFYSIDIDKLIKTLVENYQ